MMRRYAANFVVDVVTAVLLLLLVMTGLLVRWVLPAGTGHSLSLWGMSRHDWGDVHFYIALSLAVLLGVHVALHWQWVCATTLRMMRCEGRVPQGKRHVAAGLTVIALAGLIAAALFVSSRSVRPVPSQASEDHGRVEIYGSMTAAQAADAAELTLPQLALALGVTETLAPDQRMGRLCRQRGMAMHDARAAVLAYKQRMERSP